MAIPWIQVYSNLTTHPKTYALADALHLSGGTVSANITAAGMLLGIWSWAAQNAADGNISGCSSRALADAAGWRKKPETLMQVLISCGWVDRDMDKRTLHDWEEYAALYMEQVDNQRRKTKERVQRYRDKKRQQDEPNVTPENHDCNAACNVTDTPGNASTVPNLTIPNTLSSPTVQKEKRTTRPKFKKPTVEEIANYCLERKNTVDAQRFFDYYEANGWKVGKNDMKDWQATVRNWERRETENSAGKKPGAPPNTTGQAAEWEAEWIKRVKAHRAKKEEVEHD
ncbi:hypothetical protein RWV98_02835 [Agathobaculum sp. NTUH-O15-33]|uniref:hypothetical protein n=1 Tax=Agathobaculum sp. NTUH-O15-33 TaxID=3079302 RepID=UPI00295885B5|nr:hypothetical protein [Agathobaculum sp. NTUH-O15-33]WNX85228.1 hypothetical protein RWV98_02835 [Agathobaculum sp. NTUH-O15-33]